MMDRFFEGLRKLLNSRLENPEQWTDDGVCPLCIPNTLNLDLEVNSTLGSENFGQGEHFVFLKPELLPRGTGESTAIDAVLELALIPLLRIGQIDLAVLLRSDSIAARTMVLSQYQVLAAFSKASPLWANQSVLRSLYATAGPCDVMPASEAVARFWHNDAQALQRAWDQTPCMKLGPGLYARYFRRNGQSFAVLNGFFPSQLAWLTQSRGHLLALRVRTDMSLKRFRNDVIGSVRPEVAPEGSIRRRLFNAQKSLGLQEFSVSRNGVHVSPNPFDSMRGIRALTTWAGIDNEQCGFFQYACRRSPELRRHLESYMAEKELFPLQFLLHRDTEDMSWEQSLDVLRNLTDSTL